MKKFFQLYITYSKYIFKFLTTQVSMGVMGIIVGLSAIVMKSTAFTVIASVFTIGFLLFLIYDFMFMHGLNDSVRYESGNAERDKWEGLKVALLSYAPTILVVLLTIIFVLCKIEIGYTITNTILLFLLGSYFGLFDLLSENMNPQVLQVLCLLPAIIACTLGYYLGLKDKPIRKLLGIPIKPPKPPKNKK